MKSYATFPTGNSCNSLPIANIRSSGEDEYRAFHQGRDEKFLYHSHRVLYVVIRLLLVCRYRRVFSRSRIIFDFHCVWCGIFW